MNDVIPLPYSADVMLGYRHLATGVQTFLSEAVEYRIKSLERKIDGVVPLYNYSSNSLSEKEQIELLAIYEILDNQYPSWRSETEVRTHRTQLKYSNLAWYVELDSFLELSRSKSSVYGN